jgi:hypothetical protein
LIIKTNLKNKYSHIHLGLNVWEKILDNFIYPIILSHIAETMLNYISNYRNKNNKIEKFIKYLDIMASNGYSNEKTNEYKRKYKNNIEMLKILFNSFI